MPLWKQYEMQVLFAYVAEHPECTAWPAELAPEIIIMKAVPCDKERMRLSRTAHGEFYSDFGADVFALHKDNRVAAIQAKCYGGNTHLKPSCIATFHGLCVGILKNGGRRGTLYAPPNTPTSVRFDQFQGWYRESFDVVRLAPEPQSAPVCVAPTLWAHQIEAIQSIDPCGFQLISMPCGTGKTRVAVDFYRDCDLLIVCAPLIAQVEQFCERDDSDARKIKCWNGKFTDAAAIRSAVFGEGDEDPGKVHIYTTFKTMIEVLKTVEGCEYHLVVDEAHNLPTRMVNAVIAADDEEADDEDADEEDTDGGSESLDALEDTANAGALDQATGAAVVWEGSRRAAGTLMLTATPSKQLRELVPMAYELTYAEALRLKLVCRFTFVFPRIIRRDAYPMDDCMAGVGDAIAARAFFLFTAAMTDGRHHTIVFARSREETVKFASAYERVCQDYGGVNAIVGVVDCATSASTRKKLFGEFQRVELGCKTHRVLVAVRVLDEAIDLPACDSVFLMHPPDTTASFSRLVQRISRASRICPSVKPDNTCSVFVFAPGLEGGGGDWLHVLDALHALDPSAFAERTRVIDGHYARTSATPEARDAEIGADLAAFRKQFQVTMDRYASSGTELERKAREVVRAAVEEREGAPPQQVAVKKARENESAHEHARRLRQHSHAQFVWKVRAATSSGGTDGMRAARCVLEAQWPGICAPRAERQDLGLVKDASREARAARIVTAATSAASAAAESSGDAAAETTARLPHILDAKYATRLRADLQAAQELGHAVEEASARALLQQHSDALWLRQLLGRQHPLTKGTADADVDAAKNKIFEKWSYLRECEAAPRAGESATVARERVKAAWQAARNHFSRAKFAQLTRSVIAFAASHDGRMPVIKSKDASERALGKQLDLAKTVCKAHFNLASKTGHLHHQDLFSKFLVDVGRMHAGPGSANDEASLRELGVRCVFAKSADAVLAAMN